MSRSCLFHTGLARHFGTAHSYYVILNSKLLMPRSSDRDHYKHYRNCNYSKIVACIQLESYDIAGPWILQEM